MAFREALKPKGGAKHLGKIINAEGESVEAESRYDELQKIRAEETISLLISAGYFRAKIKGLSDFDKVVGGMTWCIEFCKMDLDVDLLFRENSTIGQKIALTEKIVSVLPKMNCPHNIEPHQIQGLDFIHIYPVIEWLVKKSLENRELHGDYLRQYAVHQFDKYYVFPGEKPNENFILRALPNVSAVQNMYRPERKFKRGATEPLDLHSRVICTLFEYGHDATEDAPTDEETSEKDYETVNEDKMKLLAQSMTATSNDSQLAVDAIKSIVDIRGSEIIKASEKFLTLVKESGLEESDETRLLKKESDLLHQKEQLDLKMKQAKNKLTMLQSKLKFRERESELSEDQKSVLAKLEYYLLLNSSLIEQENVFRESCKEEKARLMQFIRDADDETSECKEVDDLISRVEEQLSQSRLTLAKLSRAEAKLLRQIDRVPSRAELSQYQKRFLELYNQVAATHRETKQYYTLYNSLNDQHQYLNKELNLLNSILEGYNASLNSQQAKDEFMKQFESIVDVVKNNKLQVEQKRNEERDKRDRLRFQLSALIDQQRQYALLLKQFTHECQLNQNLLTKVNAPQ